MLRGGKVINYYKRQNKTTKVVKGIVSLRLYDTTDLRNVQVHCTRKRAADLSEFAKKKFDVKIPFFTIAFFRALHEWRDHFFASVKEFGINEDFFINEKDVVDKKDASVNCYIDKWELEWLEKWCEEAEIKKGRLVYNLISAFADGYLDLKPDLIIDKIWAMKNKIRRYLTCCNFSDKLLYTIYGLYAKYNFYSCNEIVEILVEYYFQNCEEEIVLTKSIFDGTVKINKAFILNERTYTKLDKVAEKSNITFSTTIRKILEMSIEKLFPDENWTSLKREGRKIIHKKKYPQTRKQFYTRKKRIDVEELRRKYLWKVVI